MTFAFQSAEAAPGALGEIVACELVGVRRAWWLRAEAVGRGPAPRLAALAAGLEGAMEPVREDRPLGGDVARVEGLVRRGAFAGG